MIIPEKYDFLKNYNGMLVYAIYLIKDRKNPDDCDLIGYCPLEFVSDILKRYIEEQKVEFDHDMRFFLKPVIQYEGKVVVYE